LETELYNLDAAACNSLKNNRYILGCFELLIYVYSTHPPKNETPSFDVNYLKVCSKDTKIDRSVIVRSEIKKAISIYHPDKQVRYGDKKWSYLASEITKELNSAQDFLTEGSESRRKPRKGRKRI
jgi:hypothetical protein